MMTPGALEEFLFVACVPGVAVALGDAVAVAVARDVAVAVAVARDVAVAVAVAVALPPGVGIGPRATPDSRTLRLVGPLTPPPSAVTKTSAIEAPSASGLN